MKRYCPSLYTQLASRLSKPLSASVTLVECCHPKGFRCECKPEISFLTGGLFFSSFPFFSISVKIFSHLTVSHLKFLTTFEPGDPDNLEINRNLYNGSYNVFFSFFSVNTQLDKQFNYIRCKCELYRFCIKNF